MIDCILPFCEDRTAPIDTLVFHCLAYNPQEGIRSFEDNGVSSHYMIGNRGEIYRLVSESKAAWHAGKSFWRGHEHLNSRSIGIELCSPSLGQELYDFRQIKALIALSAKIIRKYHIKPENIVGHSDIAPMRKADPGKAFPWQYLSRYGLGKWFDLKDSQKIVTDDVSLMLSEIGYDITDLEAARYAFCRHFIGGCVPKSDVFYLINHPCETAFDLDEELFLNILKAVYYQYCG